MYTVEHQDVAGEYHEREEHEESCGDWFGCSPFQSLLKILESLSYWNVGVEACNIASHRNSSGFLRTFTVDFFKALQILCF